ncbi:MAG: hypothetical protein Q8O79_06530 [Pseudomonadota bacterium]|nr:hypothetical protein [Pseudomonadota bacterium]
MTDNRLPDYLDHIRQAAEDACSFVDGLSKKDLLADRRTQSAVVMCLAACRALVVDSENRPQRGQFLPDLPAHSPAMGQKAGEKWAAAVASQPTIPKSDRLLVVIGEAATKVMDGYPEFSNQAS